MWLWRAWDLPYLQANKFAPQIHRCWNKTQDSWSEAKDFVTHRNVKNECNNNWASSLSSSFHRLMWRGLANAYTSLAEETLSLETLNSLYWAVCLTVLQKETWLYRKINLSFAPEEDTISSKAADYIYILEKIVWKMVVNTSVQKIMQKCERPMDNCLSTGTVLILILNTCRNKVSLHLESLSQSSFLSFSNTPPPTPFAFLLITY